MDAKARRIEVRELLKTKEGRQSLEQRNDPYWSEKLGKGLFVGYRRMDFGGMWSVRLRGVDGKQHYKPLGMVNEDDPSAFAWAKKEALQWVIDLDPKPRVKKTCKKEPEQFKTTAPWANIMRAQSEAAGHAMATRILELAEPEVSQALRAATWRAIEEILGSVPVNP